MDWSDTHLVRFAARHGEADITPKRGKPLAFGLPGLHQPCDDDTRIQTNAKNCMN
jgi:hypothetical protein